MRKLVFFLTAALAMGCVSCNKNRIYPVSGKVTYNGSPATGAVVSFFRQRGDSIEEAATMGVVREDGSFELVCGSLGKGAPIGEYDVLIEWKPVSGESNDRRRHAPDILQGRYADPKHPMLHATVEAKSNDLPAFELTN